MQKKEQYKRLIMFLLSTVIVALLTAVFAYVWYTFYADDETILIKVFWRRGNYVLIGLYALMTVLLYKVVGGFKVGYLRIWDALVSQVIAIVCVNAVTYLQLCLIGHWKFLQHLTPIWGMTAVDLVLVVLWSFFSRGIYLKVYPPKKLLLVGEGYNVDMLLSKLATRGDKYIVQETISHLDPPETIKGRIDSYQSVILGDIPSSARNELLKYCFSRDIRCYSVPKITDILIRSATDIDLFDTTLLLFRNIGLSVESQFLKRLFDIVASALGLVLISPLMLCIAVCIKLYDGGPVFFTQDRLTKGGKVFKIYKFRSMKMAEEQEKYCMTRKNDERITPVGKIIRDFHLDELPQLLNILKGEMSIVGPRPECPELAEKYGKSIPEFDFRLKVKAGLTGYAQVYGQYNTTPYDKLKLDLTYIENYSFRLDMKLILLTVKILFYKEKTEGIEEWQTAAATREEMEEKGNCEDRST